MFIKKTKMVNINDIIIPDRFKDHPPKTGKIIRKTAAYILFEEMSPILLDKNKTLKDGYCSYLISKEFGVKRVKCIYTN